MCIILRILLKHKFYTKLFKYTFNCNKIIFLNFVINKNNIKIKKLYIKVIVN